MTESSTGFSGLYLSYSNACETEINIALDSFKILESTEDNFQFSNMIRPFTTWYPSSA